MVSSPPHRLFHYTSLDALVEIRRTKTLWATAIGYLNDKHEYLHFLEHIRRRLALELQKTENLDNQLLRQVLTRVSTEVPAELDSVYVSSFSTDGDQLALWRAYCPKGGVSIGFDTSKLIESALLCRGQLKECVYNAGDKTPIVEEWVREPLTLLSSPGFRQGDEDVGYLNSLRMVVVRYAPIFKNEGFSSEHEWRLVFDADQTLPVQFRASGGALIPYIEFKLNEAAILEITAAPDMRNDVVRGIRKMFPNVEVRSSSIPFRGARG